MNFYIIIHAYMVKKKMDENSCEGETSESAENASNDRRKKTMDDVSQLKNAGVRINFEGNNALNPVSERCGSSIDASASGPSTDYARAKPEDDGETVEIVKTEEHPLLTPESQQPSVPTNEEQSSTMALPVNLGPHGSQQLSTCVEEQETNTLNVGPPPSYSFVMKEKKKIPKPTLTDPVMVDRLPPPPPPSYSGNRGLGLTSEENALGRYCNLPSLAEPLWRSHSQPALCPRCGIIILTTIHSHDSLATHMAALALCLFGCWPCCLLPYCMSLCKNTYHHCPICQSFLGAYTPW